LRTEQSIGRRRSLAVASIITAVLLAPATARAYRPFDGTDADVAEAKTVEVEVAPAEVLVGQEGSHAFRAPSLALSFGLGGGYELGLDGANVVTPHPEPGEPRMQFIDAAMGVKKLLRDGHAAGEARAERRDGIRARVPGTRANRISVASCAASCRRRALRASSICRRRSSARPKA
jgi:hypothetical protein